MTTKQKEFVEKLSGRQALKLYGDLFKKDRQRAKVFWTAWLEAHPENPQTQQKETQIIHTETHTHFEFRVKDEKQKAIFELLSDMKPHSRQELLELFQKKGWSQDIEFRKHISEIRKHLAACMSPYYIPLNPKGKGYGIYQLKERI